MAPPDARKPKTNDGPARSCPVSVRTEEPRRTPSQQPFNGSQTLSWRPTIEQTRAPDAIGGRTLADTQIGPLMNPPSSSPRRKPMPPPLPRRALSKESAVPHSAPQGPLPSVQSALDAIDAAVSHRIARRPNLSRAAPDEELAATIPAAMSLSAAALVEQPPKGTGAGRLALLVLTTVLCCAGVGFSYLGQLERMVSMLCDLIRV